LIVLPVKLTVKALDDDKRIITGIASTPTPDRMGDVVEPMGARFKLPMPLLWQHDHKAPVGRVVSLEATPTGIKFRAEVARIAEEGTLRERTEEAWQSIKAGLVSAVSIGFRALDDQPIRGGGRRFVAWDFLELSLVTIPANADATISSFHGKSAAPDDPIRARLTELNAKIFERVQSAVIEPAQPATGRKTTAVKFSVEVLGGVIDAFGIVTVEMMREIARLERRLADVEGRKSMNYRGTFLAGQKYDAGDALTHRGSLWWCCSPTSEPPGESDQWQLAVKKGRDGHRDNRGVHHHDE
jgi:HK97 family phage prohead protease